MNQTFLRKLRRLETLFQTEDKEPVILVQMWRPDHEEDFLEMVEYAAERICRGEKLVIVPIGGVEVLKKMGVV